MARILKLEFLAPAAENRTNALRNWSSFFRILTRCRIAHPEVVDAFGVVLPGNPICLSKVSPSLVDGDDGTRLVDNRYVRGETIQSPLPFLTALGFFFPGSLLASKCGKQLKSPDHRLSEPP